MKADSSKKTWWTRPLVYVLALALTLGSYLPVLPSAHVQAAPAQVGPGGVTDGLSLWLRPDVGVTSVVYNVYHWEDQSGSGNHATQTLDALRPTLDVNPQNLVNFNPMLTFSGSSLQIENADLPIGTAARSIVAVAQTSVDSGYHYILSWGAGATNQMMGFIQGDKKGIMTGYGNCAATCIETADNFWELNTPNELFGTYDGTNGSFYSKMASWGTSTRNWNTASGNATIGALLNSSDTQSWEGKIADIIVYDKVLTAQERQQISSYLSLKYGYTLVNANYLNAAADVIWNNTDNAGYTRNIAGIGRDDVGQLNQKQSNSTNSGAQVIVSLGDIQTSNADNPSVFPADKQYVIWGDNGLSTALDQEIGNNGDSGKHMNRIWKVQRTGAVHPATVAFPALQSLTATGAPVLLVSDDASDFSQAAVHNLTQQEIKGGQYYVASGVTLNDGQYFTYGQVFTTPSLTQITFANDGHGNKTIKVKFDGPVDLEQIPALKVTYDGEALSYYAGVTSGDELILLVSDPRVIKADDIIVSYDGQGGLVGATSRKSVAPFSQSPVDPLAAALSIVKPEPVSAVPELELAGNTLADASVTAVVYNQDGQAIYQAGPVTADANGKWTLPDTDKLADGVYQIVVSTEKDGAIAQVTRTVIVTSALREQLAAAKAYKAAPYTTESWNQFQAGLAEVERLLQADPFNATLYAEAQAKLQAALNALVPLKGELQSVGITAGTDPVVIAPTFRSDLSGTYTAEVGYAVDKVAFAPVAAEANTTQKLTLNGVEVDASDWDKLPLQVGKNTIKVSVYDQDGQLLKTYDFEITRNPAPYWGGGGGGYIPPVDDTDKDVDSLASVNGQSADFATAKKDGESTTVTIDRERLGTILADGAAHELRVSLKEDGPVAVKGLTAEDIRQIRESGSVLEIDTPSVRYPVSLSIADLQTLSAHYNDAPLDEIAAQITIHPTAAAHADAVRAHADQRGLEVLVDPVHVSLSFEYDGETATIDRLSQYAPVYIALPEGIDPNRITTGVITYPDGTIFHMPTVVIKSNNRYYAAIHALFTAGDYTVIWNPKAFDDVKGHWSEEAANNMGARLVIEGIGDNLFGPNREVTRAEFAAFVSRGLGLMRQQVAAASYADVNNGSWYHDAVSIADEYGIVSGFEDGLYRPNQHITREQGMALIARALRLIDANQSLSDAQIAAALNRHPDGVQVSGWAKADVALLINRGIVQGESNQLLNPQDNMTRAEAAALVHRILQYTELID